MSAKISSGFAALLLAGLTLPAQSPTQSKINDTILRKDGAPLRGIEILEMTSAAIKYKQGEQPGEIATKDVVGVQWSDPPEQLATAQAAEAKGEYENAANLYLELAKNAARQPFKQDVEWLAGQAMLKGMGDDTTRANTTASALQQYLKDFPQGFRAREAKIALARSLRVGGKPGDAEAMLKEFEDQSLKENWGLVWDARAKLERALALSAQGKPGDARGAFQSVVSAAEAALREQPSTELQDLRLQGIVGQGETYITEKQYDPAIRYFAALEGNNDPAIKAAGLAGEGEALFLQASGDAKNAQKLRQAQLRLAEANLLDPTSGNTTAKALYYAGKVLLALGPAAESDEFKARALDYFNAVATEYSTTRWAVDARAELKKK